MFPLGVPRLDVPVLSGCSCPQGGFHHPWWVSPSWMSPAPVGIPVFGGCPKGECHHPWGVFPNWMFPSLVCVPRAGVPSLVRVPRDSCSSSSPAHPAEAPGPRSEAAAPPRLLSLLAARSWAVAAAAGRARGGSGACPAWVPVPGHCLCPVTACPGGRTAPRRAGPEGRVRRLRAPRGAEAGRAGRGGGRGRAGCAGRALPCPEGRCN